MSQASEMPGYAASLGQAMEQQGMMDDARVSLAGMRGKNATRSVDVTPTAYQPTTPHHNTNPRSSYMEFVYLLVPTPRCWTQVWFWRFRPAYRAKVDSLQPAYDKGAAMAPSGDMCACMCLRVCWRGNFPPA